MKRGERMGTIYKMENTETGSKIETTKKYMVSWIARGFNVVEIVKEDDESSNEEEEEIAY